MSLIARSTQPYIELVDENLVQEAMQRLRSRQGVAQSINADQRANILRLVEDNPRSENVGLFIPRR